MSWRQSSVSTKRKTAERRIGHDDDFVARANSLRARNPLSRDPLMNVCGDDIGFVEAIAARPEAMGTPGPRLYARRGRIKRRQRLGTNLGGRTVRWRGRRNPLVFLQRTSSCKAPYFTGAGTGPLAEALC